MDARHMLPTIRARQRIAARLSQALRLTLPLLSLVLALWACGVNPTVTRHPASHLRLSITFQGQFTGNTHIVLVDPWIYESDSGAVVYAAKGARLTCEGVDVTPNYDGSNLHDCPLQPPGGAYHMTYTDEHGVATTAVVPVPTGSFAVLSPQVEEKVAIPTDNTLAIRYRVPTPAAGGRVSIDRVEATCGEIASSPCGDVTFGGGNEAGRTVSGGEGTFYLTGDFSSFQPREGTVSVEIGVHVQVPADGNGFASVNATFSDGFAPPVTWTR